MTVSGKIKSIHSKIEQTKNRFIFDRETAKISVLSSQNVGKYKFLTGKDLLPKKDLLEKAAVTTRYKYSSLGSGLKKKQTGIAEKQYQKLKNTSC